MSLGFGFSSPAFGTVPSLLAQALSAIRRNGGTALYVPDDYGLVLGPELITNGDFSAGTTGWSSTNIPAPAVVDGEYVVTASGSEHYPGGSQTVNCVVGKRYRLTVTGRRGTTTSAAAIYAAFTIGGSTVVAAGFSTTTVNTTYSTSFVADGNGAFTVTPHISGAPPSAGTAFFDNISVREIISATTFIDSTGTQPVTAVGDLVGLLTDRSYGAGNLGVELVNLSSAWQILGSGVSQDTGASKLTFTATPAAQFAKYGEALTVGSMYSVEFTLASVSGGSVSLKLGGGATTTPTSTPGTYKAILKATQTDGPYFWADTGPVTAVFTDVSVREVLGNHATQPTTASKPLVTRVPKRLGPNLVVNGGFDVDANWTKGAGVTISAGVASIGAGSGYLEQGVTTAAGKIYRVLATASGNPVYCGAWDSAGQGGALSGSPAGRFAGLVEFTFTANDTASFIGFAATGAGALTLDNISVQEVLEWTPALDFDGSNDLLTLSSGAILQQGSDHWVTAAFVLDAVGQRQGIFSVGSTSSDTPRIAYLNVSAANAIRCSWQSNAFELADLTGSTVVAGVPYVVTASKVGTLYRLWLNGTLVASVTSTVGTSTVNTANIGALVRTTQMFYFNGKIIDIAIDQGTLTEADRKTIERNMANRAGVVYAG